MSTIGFYNSVVKKDGDTPTPIELLDFLEGIKDGQFEDLIWPIRNQKDKKLRRKLKEDTLPCITGSGIFKDRTDASLLSHSGYIFIDIDDDDNSEIDIVGLKKQFETDEFVFSAFTSCSGLGLCLIFKIDGAKHREAFLAISAYIGSRYKLIVDPSGVNESRLRYVSFDPHLYLNSSAKGWRKYLPKEEKKKEFEQPLFVKDDFEQMIVKSAPYNDADDYRIWMAFGYALADKFGERGGEYWYALSRTSSKYDYAYNCKIYKAIIRTLSVGKEKQAKIATIYYYAKKHGVPFYGQRTGFIVSTTKQLKQGGINVEGVVRTLEVGGIPEKESKELVEQVFGNTDNRYDGADSIIVKLENWLRFNYKFRRNVITRRIEVGTEELNDTKFNSIYVAAKKIFGDKVKTEMIQRTIESSFTPDYNPCFEFFGKYKNIECDGTIKRFLSCVEVTDPELFEKFFKCWYIGMISSIYGIPSRYCLVLCGEQLSGKTEFFRRLLPPELKRYYDESQLDAGKDDEILMTQRIIICDDEFGGKSKRESEHFKNLTSRKKFTIRAPYGRFNEELIRLAILCGTTNKKDILVDWTGNTRILPIEVLSINFEEINKIGREELLMEAHRLFKSGERWELTKEEAKEISEQTKDFEEHTLEYELINKYFELPTKEQLEMDWVKLNTAQSTYMKRMTAADIMGFIDDKEKTSSRKINHLTIGRQLKKIGFYSKFERKESGKQNSPVQLYRVIISESKPIDTNEMPF